MKNLPKILFIIFVVLFSITGICLLFLLTGHMINAPTPLPKLLFVYVPFLLILIGLIALIWRIILIKKTGLIKWISFGFVILTLLFIFLLTLRREYYNIAPDYSLVFFFGLLFGVIVLLVKPENGLLFKINISILLGFELFMLVFFLYNIAGDIFYLPYVIIVPLLIFPLLYFIKFHTIVWFKWVSLGVLALLEIYFIIEFIIYRQNEFFTGNSISLLCFCVFAVLLTLILFIRKHRWTRFVFAFYSLLIILVISSFFIYRLQKVHNIDDLYYKDIRLIMQNKNHKNKKVIYQEHTRFKRLSREVYIEEKFFIFRTEFRHVTYTGIWYEYDDSGNFSQLRAYSSDGTLTFRGNVDEDKVIYPETEEKLFEVIESIVPEQRIELNDEYIIESDLEIARKNNFIITPVLITQIKGKAQDPVIKNPENTRSGLILKDCENVTIDGLTLNLMNESAHYPGIISLYKCKNVEIKNCSIEGSAEYGIYIHNSCRNIQVRRNRINGYRQYGCFTEYGNSVVENNYFENSNRINVENLILSKNDLIQIYKDSFESTYTNMYDDDYYSPLKFKTYSLGMYMGTPGHVKYDSGILSATEDFFDSMGLSDLSMDFFIFLMEQISGIPVYIPPDKLDSESPWYLDESEMSYYNPEFILWAGKHLIPEPDHVLLGSTYQQLYDHCYKRFFRVLAETYMYIRDNLVVEEYVTSFVNEIKETGTPQYYLESHFSDLELETDYDVLLNYWNYGYDYDGYYYDDEEYYGMFGYMFGYYSMYPGYYDPYEIFDMSSDYILTPQNAIGFWFRRYIDGTSDEVWEVLLDLFEKYDTEWYNGERMYYY